MIDINDLEEDSSSGANLISMMETVMENIKAPSPIIGRIEFRQDVFDYLDRHDIILSDGNGDYVLIPGFLGSLVRLRAVIARLPRCPNVGSVQTAAFANEVPRIPQAQSKEIVPNNGTEELYDRNIPYTK